MIERNKIENVVKESLTGTEVFLVDIHVSRSQVIQVFIDHQNGVSLDDCAELHRRIEESLDREQEDFELQVSSPGLGQPIRVFPQYLKAQGEKLEITLTDGESFRGILLEARPGQPDREAELAVRREGTKRKPVSEEPFVIEVNRIKTAHVVIDFKKV